MDKELETKKGLGDFVEKVIEKVAPELAKKAKAAGCNCNERKILLNNIGAIFST